MTPEQWRRVFALVRASHAEADSQRPSFLQVNCADDREVLEAAQSLLLQMGAPSGHALDEHTALSPAERVDPGPEQSDLRFPRGSAFGRYVVLELLGKGGMGVVFAAYDPELDRKVAIKVISPEWSQRGEGTDGRARLLREAKAMARLSHVNVITVYDVGIIKDEVFISMEYVDGGTLKDWLAPPRGWREILEMFVQAGCGLSAAHSAGIVHRDFKPQNVLVGKDGRARVVDFGVARGTVALDEEPRREVSCAVGSSTGHTPLVPMTKTGALIGTPAYMAPEQLAGRPIDARTDQFSFCAALYEALYGELPFGGDTLPERLNTIERGRLSTSRPASSVPRWLREVLARGLSANPEARYPSMDAVLHKLQRNPRQLRTRLGAAAAVVLLVGGTAWTSYRIQSNKRQLCRGAEERLASVWGPRQKQALSTAFLATGLPYAADAMRSVSRTFDDYGSRWVAMETEACEATRLRGNQSEELLDLRMSCLAHRREELKALADIFATADGKVVEKAVTAAHGLSDLQGCADVEALKAPLKLPADAAVRDKVEEVRLRLAHVKALNEAGKYAEALPLVREATKDGESLKYRPLEAETLLELGVTLMQMGDYRQSEEVTLRAALTAESVRHEEVAANGWKELTFISYLQAKQEAAELWAKLGFAAVERIGGNDRILLSILGSLGSAYAFRGRFEEALDYDRRALALAERVNDIRRVAAMLNNIGTILKNQGKYAEALALYQRSLSLNEQRLGPMHPDLGATLNNIGALMNNQKKYEEALPYYQRSLEIKERSLGPNHPSLTPTLQGMANIFVSQHRYEEGLQSYQRARLINEKTVGEDHPLVADNLAGMGDTYLKLGQASKALPLLERALQIYESKEVDAARAGEARFLIARALVELKRELKRARALAAQAHEAFQKAAWAQKDLEELEEWLAENSSTMRWTRRR